MPEVKFEKKYETVVSSGQSALKALLAMNGGATLALLTFIGNVNKQNAVGPDAGRVLIDAMQFFIIGTFMTVLAFGTIFVTNCFSSIGWRRASNWFFGITIVCGVLSLGSFVWASWSAIKGFGLFRIGG